MLSPCLLLGGAEFPPLSFWMVLLSLLLRLAGGAVTSSLLLGSRAVPLFLEGEG